MAVVGVDQMWDSRGSSYDIGGTRKYTRTFRVFTDSRLTEGREIATDLRLPQIGDSYAQDTGAVMVSASIDQTSDPLVWVATVQYDSSTGVDQENQDENPLFRPMEIEFGFQQFQKAIQKDLDDKPIQTAAAQLFDPPVTIDDSRPILRIRRNEASFSPSLAVDFQDAVNANAFAGGQAGEVKIAFIAATRMLENGITFWQVTYEFHYRRDGWQLELVNRGTVFIDAGGKQAAHTVDAKNGNLDPTGTKVTPVYLTPTGTILASQNGPYNYLDFRVYEEKDFGALQITFPDGSLF